MGWARKGDKGRVLIISGSDKYVGSPVFNSICALRAGADWVTVCTSERAALALSNYPDVVVRISPSFDELRSLIEAQDILLIGCGMLRTDNEYSKIRRIIKYCNKLMVIDAEAIRALKNCHSILRGKTVILTPHANEFFMLTGELVEDTIEDRKAKVLKWSRRLGCIILLKGKYDIISDGRRVLVNKSGCDEMTKAGFGDCLAGICSAFLFKYSPLIAAFNAALINGLAGEMVAKKSGSGILASDIFPIIPLLIKRFL